MVCKGIYCRRGKLKMMMMMDDDDFKRTLLMVCKGIYCSRGRWSALQWRLMLSIWWWWWWWWCSQFDDDGGDDDALNLKSCWWWWCFQSDVVDDDDDDHRSRHQQPTFWVSSQLNTIIVLQQLLQVSTTGSMQLRTTQGNSQTNTILRIEKSIEFGDPLTNTAEYMHFAIYLLIVLSCIIEPFILNGNSNSLQCDIIDKL